MSTGWQAARIETPVGTAPDKRQVFEWINKVRGQAERLHKQAGELHEELEPVLRSEPPNPKPDSPEPVLVPLAATLRDILRILQDVSQTHCEIIDRLEL